MEFTIVSLHEGQTLSEHLNSMTIVSIPDAYLVYTGCESKEEYIKSIVTYTLDVSHTDLNDMLKNTRYAPVNGKIVFRHIKTMRTATIAFCADCVLLEDKKSMYVSKIRHIHWQDNDEMVMVLGTTAARIALGVVRHKILLRNETRCIAVPIKNVPYTTNAKNSLEFLKCEFGVNVSFSIDGYPCTVRSLVCPSTLLLSDLPDLSHLEYWAYADFTSTTPYFMEASPKFLTLFGLKKFGGDMQTNLAKIMTSETLSTCMTSIVPVLGNLESGATLNEAIELVTVHGKENIDCTWYKTRSIVIGCLHVKEEL